MQLVTGKGTRLFKSFPQDWRGVFSICKSDDVLPVQPEAGMQVFVFYRGQQGKADPSYEFCKSLVPADLHDVQAFLWVSRKGRGIK